MQAVWVLNVAVEFIHTLEFAHLVVTGCWSRLTILVIIDGETLSGQTCFYPPQVSKCRVAVILIASVILKLGINKPPL